MGKQSYTAFSTHGASGARLDYTKIKAALDLYRFTDVEMVLMGHVHSLNHMTQLFRRVDRHRKVVESFKRHAVLTGSFLRYPESYAEMKLLNPTPLGVARITLSGKEHRIHVSV